MRARRCLTVFMLAGVFVSARISTSEIISALEEEYGAGEYVNPEGPLNIMRGHPCVNNGMIAKQRKYAAPMRLAYSCTGDGSRGNRTYTRNADEDEVRGLSADNEAMVYLSEHYRILKSMFTIERDVVVVDQRLGAPFCKLVGRKHVELLAALLVLAGGGDIRLGPGGNGCTDGDEGATSLAAHDAVTGTFVHVLGLESANSATLEVVKFFVKYGGNNADQVAGYGLHYTDSPSFLIQAYICEFIGSHRAAMQIFEAAKEIVAKLPAGDPSVQLRSRLFTTDVDYVRGYRGIAGYSGLVEAEVAFSGVQPALLRDWLSIDYGEHSAASDPKRIISALLKLCRCLSMNPAVERWLDRMLLNPWLMLRNEFRGCVSAAREVLRSFNMTGVVRANLKDTLVRRYRNIFEVAMESERRTTTGYSSANISTVPLTDPKDFLVVLARALGESEEKLRSLQQLLKEALSDTGDTSICSKISDRVNEMLRKFSSVRAKAYFDVCTPLDGARFGMLWFSIWPNYDGVRGQYTIKLVFKPEKVEVVYVSQKISLDDERHDRLVSALRKQDPPSDPARKSTQGASNGPCVPSLCSLIQESIERCLDPAAHRALADAHIAEAYAAKDPLACHIAIGRWMAYTPMQSLGDAVRAGDRLLPVLEGLLAQSAGISNPAQRALTADSPAVALLDNILGSATAVDDTLRFLIPDGLRRCVGVRTDLFPSIFPPMAVPFNVLEWDEPAYDCFTACFMKFMMREMLVRHAELRARDIIWAARDVRGPWSSKVCFAVGRCLKLRHENSMCSSSSAASDVSLYKHDSSAFIDVAGRAKAAQDAVIKAANAQAEAARAAAARAEGAQVGPARVAAARAAGGVEFLKKSNFCADAANLCAAAAKCFLPRHGNGIPSLSGDTPDACYYRYSVFFLVAGAACPALYDHYCDMLRDISVDVRWGDTYSVIEMYVLLERTFRKLPRPVPLSPKLVADVFSGGPTVKQVKSLLRIFALFARTDRDYCGLCRVFSHFRRVLSPEYARAFVKLLKDRDDAYRRALRIITFHRKIWSGEGHALPYSAFMDLLVECVENDTIPEQMLLERIQELLGVKDLLGKESSCINC
ncbi:hypothetical protein PAPHI01_0925 [Pancytospora philotis]|nr:hypothetical protein PAPHI01_0925 [Pancytospora philotis]